MNNDVHQMSLLVGQIAGELKGLKESVESLNRVWGEREAAATAGRRSLHDKIERMSSDFERVQAAVDNMVIDIRDSIKPAIDSFKTERDKEAGAEVQSKKFYSALALLAGVGGGGIAELIHRWLGHA